MPCSGRYTVNHSVPCRRLPGFLHIRNVSSGVKKRRGEAASWCRLESQHLTRPRTRGACVDGLAGSGDGKQMADRYTALLGDSLDGRYPAPVRTHSGSVPSTAVSQRPGTEGGVWGGLLDP